MGKSITILGMQTSGHQNFIENGSVFYRIAAREGYFLPPYGKVVGNPQFFAQSFGSSLRSVENPTAIELFDNFFCENIVRTTENYVIGFLFGQKSRYLFCRKVVYIIFDCRRKLSARNHFRAASAEFFQQRFHCLAFCRGNGREHEVFSLRV